MLTTYLENKQKKIKFCYINQKKIIVFYLKKTNYYLEISKSFILSKSSKIHFELSTIVLNSYFNSFVTFLQSFTFLKRKILILKGLGLKVYLNKKLRVLSLKLGYSHLCNLFIKKEIFIRVKKNFLFLQSFNKEMLGNFTLAIRNLKIPNAYKGKGIWYKNEKKKLKVIKKK